MNRPIRQRILSVVLGICVVTSAVVCSPAGRVFAKTSDEVKDEISALQAQQDELQDKLDSLKDDESKQLEYYNTLQEQISSVQEEIDATIANISELDENIRELDAELDAAEQEIDSTMQLLKERIKVLYESGDESTLQILLSSNSWTEFAEKAELMKAVAEHDSQLIEEVSAYMDRTSDTRNQLQEDRETAAQLRTSLEDKQSELQGLETECEAVLEDLRAQQIEVEDQRQQTEEESNALEKELQQILADEEWQDKLAQEDQNQSGNSDGSGDSGSSGGSDETGSSGGSSTGGNYETGAMFAWPCPGYVYVSSYWGDGRGHKGVDLAANYGTPIVAAESGYVVIANSTDEWGSGWGYHVMIAHNSVYSTLYAHCSSLAVTSGQYVERGQVIAYVGNTGNSFGNHLHFEVYEYGTRVDPAPFIGL